MLPTREEAKEGLKVLEDWFNAISVPKLTKVLGKEYNRRNVLSDVIEVYKLYISGSLIEARTEGGITNFIKEQIDKEGIRNNGNNFNAHSYSPICSCGNCHLASLLAHALVGKV
jgi:hypothetical protein